MSEDYIFTPQEPDDNEQDAPVDEKPKRKRNGFALSFICLWIVAVLGASLLLFYLAKQQYFTPDKASDSVVFYDRPDNKKTFTVEELARDVRPSVVDIFVFNEKVSYDKELDLKKATASASGIIIGKDGLILTNQHVIDNAADIFVVLYDSSVGDYNLAKPVPARLIGYDAKSDIALIKIDSDGLTVAEIGIAEQAVLGEQVVAIGNPSGYSGSITTGIISGLNRKIRTDSTGYEMTCIQTDAPISPGNSGGGLFNMYGQVIGVTSSKIADTSVEGIGFAISITAVESIIDDIIDYGYVRGRFRIGIAFIPDYYDEVADTNGLCITEINENCDIFNTELQAGDIITELNGKKVSNFDDVTIALSGFKGGDSVSAKVVRISEMGAVTNFTINFMLMEDTSGDF